MDRTFWVGCAGHFAPSDIPLDGSARSPEFCAAKTWEPAVMDRLIAVHVALVHRFANEPAFLGVDTEETGIGTDTFFNAPDTALAQYEQLKRLAAAVHAAQPSMQFIQYINWPLDGDRRYFDDLASNLASLDGGAGGLQTSCGGVQPISRPPARVRVAPRSHPATRSLALCAAR